MSVHYEWVSCTDLPINIVPKGYNVDAGEIVEPEDMADDLSDIYDPERTTEGVSIILGGFDSGYVITAERKDQLVEFARTLLRMCEDFEGPDVSGIGVQFSCMDCGVAIELRFDATQSITRAAWVEVAAYGDDRDLHCEASESGIHMPEEAAHV